MDLKTRVFEFWNAKYSSLSDLAQAMGIGLSQIYRVRQGKRHINEKFIIGAVKAFPEYKLDDLFYVTQIQTKMKEPLMRVGGMVVSSRRDEVVKLRNAGLSYTEIGRRLGMSRERARQIVKGDLTLQKPDLRSKVMLTSSEVAQLLGLHPNTVRHWNKKGILKSYRFGRRRDRRFRREDIDDFLKKGKIE